jgi:type IV pilus assembly protein PilB
VGGRLKLGQILVNRGLLHPDRLAEALADQQESGARLGMTLVRLGFVDEETLIRTLASQLKLPVARIRGKRVSPDVLECIDVELAEKHRCLPLFFKQEAGERVLFVAMEDPSDAEAQAELASASGHRLRAVLVGPTELEEALQRHYHWTSLTGELFEWDASRPPSDAPLSAPEGDPMAAEAEPASPPGFEPDLPGDPDPDFDLEPDPDLAAESEPDRYGSDPSDEALWADELRDADTAPDLPDPGSDAVAADDELELDDEAGFKPDGELAAPEPAPARSVARRPGPDALDPRIILRALSQLLVEKGVITRDEFVQRLGEIAAREGAD